VSSNSSVAASAATARRASAAPLASEIGVTHWRALAALAGLISVLISIA
jgi:hypothetical protein